MCVLNRCCCCRLRTGCFVIGAFSIALAILNISWMSYFIFETLQENAPMAVIIAVGIMIGVETVFLISAILLVAGTNQRRKGMLVPWMVMAIVFCVLLTLGIVFSIVVLVQGQTTQIGVVITNILQIVLIIYCFSAVRSFYKNDCQEYEEFNKVNPSQGAVRYDGVETADHK